MVLAETPVTPLLLAAIIGGFLVAGPLLWLGVTGLIGALGWRPLHRRFPAGPWPGYGEGTRLGMQSARVGLMSYRSTLNAVLTDEGLYLRPIKLFAFNHPPVFIPWEAVERVEPTLMGTRLVLAGGGSVVGYWGLGARLRERFEGAA